MKPAATNSSLTTEKSFHQHFQSMKWGCGYHVLVLLTNDLFVLNSCESKALQHKTLASNAQIIAYCRIRRIEHMEIVCSLIVSAVAEMHVLPSLQQHKSKEQQANICVCWRCMLTLAMSAKTMRASSNAKFWPKQFLGPCMNGTNCSTHQSILDKVLIQVLPHKKRKQPHQPFIAFLGGRAIQYISTCCISLDIKSL